MKDKVDVGKISVTKQLLALRNFVPMDAKQIKDRHESDLWYSVYFHNGKFVVLGNRAGNVVSKYEFPTMLKMHTVFTDHGYEFHRAGKDDVQMRGYYI